MEQTIGAIPAIIDEHEHFWVINKPMGWTVQRDEDAPSILEWLLTGIGTKGYPVHRLDKPTSGLLLVAKTLEGNRALSVSFANRTIEKTYVALSDQKPKKKQGWIKGDMAVSRRSQWKLMRTCNKPAVTYFTSEVLPSGLRRFVLSPKTGKTHQLRVALKSLGSPILGDTLYGGTPADRMYLHAWQIKFEFGSQTYAYQCEPKGLLFEPHTD